MPAALAWSRRWLGLGLGGPAIPRRPAPPAKPEPEADPLRWLRPWNAARPIAGTLAATYLAGRGLRYDDRDGQALRFHPRRGRKAPDSEVIERHPALLAALCDVRTGEQVGIINIFLRADGRDRLRDRKGKTATGRAGGAVVMLSGFDEPTGGLVLCEGVETGCAILNAGLAPVWACGGAGTLGTFPVPSGIECLSIAADADQAGQNAAAACRSRWRSAGREVAIISPPAGDWADQDQEIAA
jgi:putative DNA primase/helicase